MGNQSLGRDSRGFRAKVTRAQVSRGRMRKIARGASLDGARRGGWGWGRWLASSMAVGSYKRLHRRCETADLLSGSAHRLSGGGGLRMIDGEVACFLGGAGHAASSIHSVVTARDEAVYRLVVPENHYLRTARDHIRWDDFRPLLEDYYSELQGRPAECPVFMMKLEFLRYQHNLSDREVIARVRTDLAFRLFLDLPLGGRLPDPSSLCRFRGRLGVNGFRKVFDEVVRQAREAGIVKDRLRIKDATHVIGNMQVPTALALVAQTRDKLLTAAEPFDPVLVEGERVNLELLRETSQALPPAERLVTRVAQLREMLIWVDALTPPENAETNRRWLTLLAQRDLAHKILEEQTNPNTVNRTLSTTDPDARCGKHGQFFNGYLVDILVDPDSEIITQVNVISAAGDEAADAVELIELEEAAHGNDISALSIDGVGFNGPVLRELQDPEGLNVDTYVPAPLPPESKLFTPQDFQEDPEQGVVVCPAGQTSKTTFRDNQKETTKYVFAADVCRAVSFVGSMHEPNGVEEIRPYGLQVGLPSRARESTPEDDHPGVRRRPTPTPHGGTQIGRDRQPTRRPQSSLPRTGKGAHPAVDGRHGHQLEATCALPLCADRNRLARIKDRVRKLGGLGNCNELK